MRELSRYLFFKQEERERENRDQEEKKGERDREEKEWEGRKGGEKKIVSISLLVWLCNIWIPPNIIQHVTSKITWGITKYSTLLLLQCSREWFKSENLFLFLSSWILTLYHNHNTEELLWGTGWPYMTPNRPNIFVVEKFGPIFESVALWFPLAGKMFK